MVHVKSKTYFSILIIRKERSKFDKDLSIETTISKKILNNGSVRKYISRNRICMKISSATDPLSSLIYLNSSETSVFCHTD